MTLYLVNWAGANCTMRHFALLSPRSVGATPACNPIFLSMQWGDYVPKRQKDEEALNIFCNRVRLERPSWFSENLTDVEREFARRQMVAGKLPITVANDLFNLRYALGPVYADAKL